MSVLICKNIEIEGPGTIEDYLKIQKIPYKIVELSRGESIPDPAGFNTLIMMGGPMSVNEDEVYPYLKEEEKLVRNFLSNDKKVLGVCLGAQIMAKALGAKVYFGPEKEIGWCKVEITSEGVHDPIFSTLSVNNAPYAEVFQWHGETFDLPQGAVRIATSEVYQNQAFRYGNRGYALQFHIEVTPEMIKEWFEDEKNFNVDGILSQTNMIYAEYYRRALNFYGKFFS